MKNRKNSCIFQFLITEFEWTNSSQLYGITLKNSDKSALEQYPNQQLASQQQCTGIVLSLTTNNREESNK